MKTLTLRYRKMDKTYLAQQIKEAMSGDGAVEPDVLYFSDVNLPGKILNETRREIMAIVKNQKPGSVYELAQIMGKDQGYISKELKFLRDFGVLEFTAVIKDGRECQVPKLIYDRLVVDISFDEALPFKKASNQ